MDLDLYERFWEKTPSSKRDYTFNGKGERLGDFQPLIQHEILEDLKQLAENENVEGWMDYVSPENTSRENMESLMSASKPIEHSATGRRGQIGQGLDPYITRVERQEKDHQQEKDKIRAERSDDGRYIREPKGYWGDDPDEMSFVALDQNAEGW